MSIKLISGKEVLTLGFTVEQGVCYAPILVTTYSGSGYTSSQPLTILEARELSAALSTYADIADRIQDRRDRR